MEKKKGEEFFFSKTVRASKLTKQRTLQINNTYLDRSCCSQYLQKRLKNVFIQGELTEGNKAPCFFSERGVIETFVA